MNFKSLELLRLRRGGGAPLRGRKFFKVNIVTNALKQGIFSKFEDYLSWSTYYFLVSDPIIIFNWKSGMIPSPIKKKNADMKRWFIVNLTLYS